MTIHQSKRSISIQQAIQHENKHHVALALMLISVLVRYSSIQFFCISRTVKTSKSRVVIVWLQIENRNPAKIALWTAIIGRHDSNSSKNWFICEVHFSANMWEKSGIDGKRKLKQHAIPTIFNNVDKKRNVKNHKSVSKTVLDNECHQVSDDKISPDLSMKISDSSEESSKECFTEVEKQTSATEDVLKLIAVCNTCNIRYMYTKSDYDEMQNLNEE
ncbi:PREDICTED: uncharacterized protein LOC106742729 isoform X2 [Dinoponera quadriceps]|uniref:Uncharacterized protein LOC106742729 isoform X2 n=1 Tax=Dinoponera quadriceps TaxID=609295 RepID=A0A6P3WZS5_DINQU|nr:PREDICTED: uncharacterized protein LOC106742729 isoform X2 [Dinoponera quadriceps]